MPVRCEQDDDGQPAPFDVRVKMPEEVGLLACGNERIDEYGRVVRLVVHAADLARLAFVVGPVLPVRVLGRPAPEAVG